MEANSFIKKYFAIPVLFCGLNYECAYSMNKDVNVPTNTVATQLDLLREFRSCYEELPRVSYWNDDADHSDDDYRDHRPYRQEIEQNSRELYINPIESELQAFCEGKKIDKYNLIKSLRSFEKFVKNYTKPIRQGLYPYSDYARAASHMRKKLKSFTNKLENLFLS